MKFQEVIELNEATRVLINDNKNYAKPGRWYNFSYSSKYYEDLHKLEFYDKNPLIIVLNHDSKYVLGLNMHYFDSKKCGRMLETMERMYEKDWKNNDAILVTWKDFQKEFDDIKPSFLIKKYIKSRIGRFSRINNTDMRTALKVVKPQFTGLSQSQVWARWRDLSR